ncbi:MAG: DUF1801 domain-containing protein [Pseudomonadota bacterium]
MALILRELIFDVAAETPAAGRVQEALRWHQPSYLTPETKSGSTLRIGASKHGGCALFAHCATDIISTYAATFQGCERIEGNRAVIFRNASEIVPDRLRLMIYHGLTYHLDEERKRPFSAAPPKL